MQLRIQMYYTISKRNNIILCVLILFTHSNLILINFFVYSSGNHRYQILMSKRNGVRSGDQGMRTFGRSRLQQE